MWQILTNYFFSFEVGSKVIKGCLVIISILNIHAFILAFITNGILLNWNTIFNIFTIVYYLKLHHMALRVGKIREHPFFFFLNRVLGCSLERSFAQVGNQYITLKKSTHTQLYIVHRVMQWNNALQTIVFAFDKMLSNAFYTGRSGACFNTSAIEWDTQNKKVSAAEKIN